MKRVCRSVTFVMVLMLSESAALAQAMPRHDLRNIIVGMRVSDLPDAGYVNLTCAGDPGRRLNGWSGWSDCPTDQDRNRSIRFEFDPESSRGGTVVAGHPVTLTAVIDDGGVIAGLDIDTDPKARLYIRKKAFLLGTQVRSRYGPEGWDCHASQPTGAEQPVGGVFVREVCKKVVPGRILTVARDLFRRPDQDSNSFIDRTEVRIRKDTD